MDAVRLQATNSFRVGLEADLKELREYVAAGGCCGNCASGAARAGTADCDVNPLRKPPSLEEAKSMIAEIERILGA